MPTLDYLTGFNHRVNVLDATTSGSTITIDTVTVRKAGGSSLKLVASGGTPLVKYVVSSGHRQMALVVYAQFSVIPTLADFFLAFTDNLTTLTNTLGISHDGANNISLASGAGGGSVNIYAVTTALWYRLEFLVNTSANPWTISAGIALGDGTTTDIGSKTLSVAAADIAGFVLGGISGVTATQLFTDLAWSLQSADYPIGPVSVYGYQPRFVGTHNLDASTSTFFFAERSAPPGGSTDALTTSESTSYQILDDLPFDTGTDAVKVTMGGTPVVNTPSVRSVGTWSFTANNVATPFTCTPGAPAGKAVGDLLLLVCESRSIVGTVATPAGWSTVAGSPVRSGTASGGTIYLFTRIADGTASDTPSPVWANLGSTGTSGDASGAGIMAIQNAQAVLDATLVSQDLAAQGATSTITGVTTVTDESVVVNVAMKLNETSLQTATVTNYTEQSDNSTTSGTGHIVETSSLVKTPLGASGSGTITWSGTTSARALIASIALKATTVLSQPTNTWYAEYGFVVPEVAVPYAVRAIVAQELDTAVSSTWAAKLYDSVQGSNTEDISNGSISTTTRAYVGKTFRSRPGGTTQSIGGTSTTFTLGNISADVYQATAFTASASGVLAPITLYLAKNSAPTDNLTVQVWSNSAGLPGSVLGTAPAIVGSSLTTSIAPYTFDVGAVPVVSGTQYWISVHRSGAADATNNYGWEGETGSGFGNASADSTPSWTLSGSRQAHADLTIAAAWTLAALAGTRLRFGYTAAASGDPRLAGAMLEAAFPAPVAEATPLVEAHKSIPFYPRPSLPS